MGTEKMPCCSALTRVYSDAGKRVHEPGCPVGRGLVDLSTLRISRVTHDAGGEALHDAADCPRDETCPVWESMHDHPLLGRESVLHRSVGDD